MPSSLTLASFFTVALSFGLPSFAQTLKSVIGNNFYIGAAVSITTLNDATFKNLAISEFSSVTAENEMKWYVSV